MRPVFGITDEQIAERLLQACAAIIDQYRTDVGHLPEWLCELEPADALKLLAASTRVGMKLPQHETLAGDQRERDRAIAKAAMHGLRKQG